MDNLKETVNLINSVMDFYSYQDFRNNSILIKKIYMQQNHRTKKLYLWYVYSRDMTEKQKNMVWDFLNNDAFFYNEKELDSKNNKDIKESWCQNGKQEKSKCLC